MRPALPPRAAPPRTNPFGEGAAGSARSKMEPSGLSPYLGPDPLREEKKWELADVIKGITTTQIVRPQPCSIHVC